MRVAGATALVTAAATAFAWLLLRAESQRSIAVLIALAIAVGVVAARTRLFARLLTGAPERLVQGFAFAAVVVLALLLHDDDFALLLVTRVLIVIVACLGLNLQFGYAGVANFAGASFFGVGGYTAAVLSRAVPRSISVSRLRLPMFGAAIACCRLCLPSSTPTSVLAT